MAGRGRSRTPGRKPKRRDQAIADGNTGHRALNDREPEYELAAPECPDHLPAEAKAEWDRRVPELVEAGAISPCHVATMTVYCEAWARYVRASLNVQKYGELLVSPKTNIPYTSPYLNVLISAEKMVLACASELGITPVSQSRIQSTKTRSVNVNMPGSTQVNVDAEGGEFSGASPEDLLGVMAAVETMRKGIDDDTIDAESSEG